MASKEPIECAFCQRSLLESGPDEPPFTYHVHRYSLCQAKMKNHKPSGFRFVDPDLERLPVDEDDEKRERKIIYRQKLVLNTKALPDFCNRECFRILQILSTSNMYPPVAADTCLTGILEIWAYGLQRCIELSGKQGPPVEELCCR